ncbi:MAG: ABC transporter ATP-binding protein [Cytophagaceae bacterium]|nr:ABC transporter ATP-binding protein [Cytophagaceae bacterium]MBP6093020.1 ABC transporter ATP-binding protein [Cytophagaceae bacterium]
MKIIATGIHKKFRQEWVFKALNYTFESGKSYAIVGQNGAGKSTLLKTLAQYSLPNKGTVEFEGVSENVNKQISFAAPYSELIEEFTLPELLSFLIDIDFLAARWDFNTFTSFIDLRPSETKYIKNFSSGMRQKVKLGVALAADRPILCLDEPTSNLDEAAKNWFYKALESQRHKLILIASNEKAEIDLCTDSLAIADYKI